MITIKRVEDRAMAERVLALTAEFMQHVASNPGIAPMIPDGATVILLPDNDLELAEHNTLLGMDAVAAGQNVYFLHVQMASVRAAVAKLGSI
jgi:hypothetical protein